MTKEDVTVELLEEDVTSSKQYPFETDTFRKISFKSLDDKGKEI